MKKILILLLFVLGFTVLKAQQLPQYTQYMINDYVLNPAIAGVKPYFEVKSNNRYQWLGITDAPRTYVLSVNGPYKSKNVGIGGYLFTDITGPTRRIGISLSYAYHLKLTEDLKLSMSLSGGILQYAVDFSKIELHDVGDIALSNELQSLITPNFGFASYLYSDKYYIGLSIPQLIASKVKFFDYTTSSLNKLNPHFYIMGGYKYTLNDNFNIEPSFLLKYVNPAPVMLDLGARVIYQEKMWAGLSYRTHDAVAILLGYNYQDDLSFAYSYDFSTSNIRHYSSGTHEIMLGIKFAKKN